MDLAAYAKQIGVTELNDSNRAIVEAGFNKYTEARSAGTKVTQELLQAQQQLQQAQADRDYTQRLELYANTVEAQAQAAAAEAERLRLANLALSGGTVPTGEPIVNPNLPPTQPNNPAQPSTGFQRPLTASEIEAQRAQAAQDALKQPVTLETFRGAATDMFRYMDEAQTVSYQHQQLFGTPADPAKLAELRQKSLETNQPMTTLAQTELGFAAKQQELQQAQMQKQIDEAVQAKLSAMQSQNPTASIGLQAPPMNRALFADDFRVGAAHASARTVQPNPMDSFQRFNAANEALARQNIHFDPTALLGNIPGVGN